MKKLIFCLVIVLTAFAAFGCGDDDQKDDQKDQSQQEQEGTVTGGWEVNTDYGKSNFPDDAADAFSKFVDEINDELTPVAYIGFEEDKEDGDKTYEYIAYSKTDKELQAVSVEINKYGKPDIGDIQSFDITKYTEGDGADQSVSDNDGFVIPDDYAGSSIPKDVQKVFLSSAKTLDGNALNAIAYLGSQVVNGSNYAMLCVGETVTEQPVKNVQLVVVNQDSSGKCSVVNINTLDLEMILEDDNDDDDEEGDD
ncbi:MAG: hypothetical protein UHP11_03575 [Anaerovoracaceae bacterium]|nr:hypothetical protein [Anaerovoracaceae bacterium]